jgi:lysophospholipase L1-like esterase
MRRRNLFIGLLALVAVGIAAESIARAVHGARHSSAPLRRGTVSLVGDSLNVGVEPYLEAALGGWTIETDDVVGRSTATGLEHLRERGAALGRYVVISLGTNDPRDGVDAFRADVTQVLQVAGGRCVVWATIHRDGNAYAPFNEVLRDEAAANRNLRLVEWTSMLDSHPDWLAADGIHGTPDGYRARAAAIVTAMRSCPGGA